jgi:serralysin
MASTRDEADIDEAFSSGDPTIDGLLGKYYWSKLAREDFRFIFPERPEDFEDTRDGLIDDYPSEAHERVVAPSFWFVRAVQTAVEWIDEIVDFDIKRTGGSDADVQLRYAVSGLGMDPPLYGSAHWPRDDGLGEDQENWMSGDMFYARKYYDAPLQDPVGTTQYLSILHATGHALGLKHGHIAEDGRGALPLQFDTLEFTVMTSRAYFDDDPTRPVIGFRVPEGNSPQTLMMLDIQALQYLYGADYTTNADKTVYRWREDGTYLINDRKQWTPATDAIFMTVWDGGGVDAYDFSAFDTDQQVDLAPGSWSDFGSHRADLGDGARARGNVFNALLHQGNGQSLIENATTGGGNDTLSGNTADNRLSGGDGRDDLFGRENDDTLIGNAGDDELIGAEGNDLLAGGGGGDLMNGGVGIDFVDYSGTRGETVVLTPFGPAENGTWRVRGSDQAEGDTLAQIEGFVFGKGDDRVTLKDSAAVLRTTIDGREGRDTITGGDGLDDVDRLIGGAGSDVVAPGFGKFEAFGGRFAKDGVTRIEGIGENDLLLLDRSGAGDGYLLSHLGDGDRPLGFFADEFGSLAFGFARISLIGSAFDDLVAGGIGDDTMEGRGGGDSFNGGKGADRLVGESGNDALSGDEGADTLLGGAGLDGLLGGEGDDLLDSGEATGDGIEGAGGGLGRDTLIGGAGKHSLGGDEDADLISSGAGEDQINGGSGNDTLEGGADADFVTGGDGIDWALYRTSNAAVTVDLTATAATGGHAEDDVLTGIENLIGSRFADTLSGDAGANVLGGGAGADRLTGRGGADAFLFSNKPVRSADADRIVDYAVEADRVRGDRDAFAGLGPAGKLAADRFHVGANAADAEDRIVYDRATGGLFYDADGSGSGAAVRFATLAAGLNMTEDEFRVV